MEFANGSYRLIKEYKPTGQIWIVEDLDTSKPDTNDIMHIAECFASMGCIVKIPRPVHFKSEMYRMLFGGLIGTRYEKKCPDLCVDGKYYEYESYVRPWNKRKLSNMLSDGLRQSDRLIIDNRGGAKNTGNRFWFPARRCTAVPSNFLEAGTKVGIFSENATYPFLK